MKNWYQENYWTPYTEITLALILFYFIGWLVGFVLSRIACFLSHLTLPCFFNIREQSGFTFLLLLLLLLSEETHELACRLTSLSLGLTATSALRWHHHILFWLQGWLLLLQAEALLAVKLSQCNRARWKQWQAGATCTMLPLPMGEMQLWMELPSGLPLHGWRPRSKLLSVCVWLLCKPASWGKHPAEHGNVLPCALNVFACAQPQNILLPFDAVHDTQRVLMCCYIQPGKSHQERSVLLWEHGWQR